MGTEEPGPYESPRIVDFGDFAALTKHQLPGDPLDHPYHGGDPHLTSSITT
jgi:hypothetical protein